MLNLIQTDKPDTDRDWLMKTKLCKSNVYHVSFSLNHITWSNILVYASFMTLQGILKLLGLNCEHVHSLNKN